ncbi:MAG: EAL domain-containing protein [Magnetococcus sp. DMHC-8]
MTNCSLQPIWQQLVHEQIPNQHENHWQAKNGEQFLIAWSNNVIRHSDGSLRSIIATGMDVTEQRRNEQRLQHVAGHDALTGLPNRALFQVRLGEHLSLASRTGDEVVLLFLDLDRFKQVNDTMGHQAGDELLREATRRILSCVRQYDLVARLGGDEFTIILPQLSHLHTVELIARRILEELARPFSLEQGVAHISGSIGITLFPRDGREMETLLKQADAAMYCAKSAGRNTFRFFTEEMQVAAMHHLHQEEALRAALHNQEFVLHYQPRLDLASRQIIGVEALLRWQRADGALLELVPPNAFLDLAEETGLIVPLGAWVLQTACRQAKSWQDQGLPPLQMAVNLAPDQFRQPDTLIEMVTQVLQETRLDPACLELEITEKMIMADEAGAVQTMNRLRSLHVKWSIDNFGTGHSSLGSLTSLPVQAVKIDERFIQGVTVPGSEAAVTVRAMLALANRLQLRVVAEGVETAAQWQFLQEQGCDALQGFCCSHPLPADRFAEWVQQHGTGIATWPAQPGTSNRD